ncbi:MAG: SelB C-terminal domain-containing protein, partial [Propionibacteriaceae bacterium]|nr:SelB C-terminal domain-containing protein [Propionibacteriaceae bacterium]
PERIDLVREVSRRGYADSPTLQRLGLDIADASAGHAADGLRRHGQWFIAADQWQSWREALTRAVTEHVRRNPLQGRMSMQAATEAVGLPLDAALLESLVSAAGLTLSGGYVLPEGAQPDLGGAEQGLQRLEQRLAQQPFRAPERDDLSALGLGVPEIAAAVRLSRLIDLGEQIVLLPKAPALAMRELVKLPQPFTTSQARQALDTTRRVVIPLLEHLDAKGWTRRLDGTLREVARSRG